MRTLIVDDEPLARTRLAQLCQHHAELDVVAQAGSGAEALDAIRTHEPELMMLDIELPDMSGFDLLRQLEPVFQPMAIVVAPHAQYALRAFDNGAVDYLTKPVDPTRFLRAVNRARSRGGKERGCTVRAACVPVSEAAHRSGGDEVRLVGEKGNRLYFLGSTSVDYIEVDGNYVTLHSGNERYISRRTLKHMATTLEPCGFLQIERSVLLNLQRVAFVEKLSGGGFAFMLRSGKRLICSASYRKAIHQVLRRG